MVAYKHAIEGYLGYIVSHGRGHWMELGHALNFCRPTDARGKELGPAVFGSLAASGDVPKRHGRPDDLALW